MVLSSSRVTEYVAVLSLQSCPSGVERGATAAELWQLRTLVCQNIHVVLYAQLSDELQVFAAEHSPCVMQHCSTRESYSSQAQSQYTAYTNIDAPANDGASMQTETTS